MARYRMLTVKPQAGGVLASDGSGEPRKCQRSGLYFEAPSLLADALSHVIGQPFTVSRLAGLC